MVCRGEKSNIFCEAKISWKGGYLNLASGQVVCGRAMMGTRFQEKTGEQSAQGRLGQCALNVPTGTLRPHGGALIVRPLGLWLIFCRQRRTNLSAPKRKDCSTEE